MLALSSDKKRVYSGNIPGGNVTAFDLTTFKSLGVAPAEKGSEGIAISPDGKWIWTGNRGPVHSVSIIDAESLKKVKDIPSQGLPYRVAFTPSGKYALVPHPVGGELVIFDAAKMDVSKRVNFSAGPVKVRFTRA